jgi:hypothetical protein
MDPACASEVPGAMTARILACLLVLPAFLLKSACAAEFAHRTHSLTFEAAFDTPQEYDAAFGFDHWERVTPYLDMVMTGPGILNTRVRAANFRTMTYFDPNLCSATRGYGANQYASPDCSDWPSRAFYTQPGHPDRTLSASYDGKIIQRYGDPGSPEFQARTTTLLRERVAHDQFELIEIDDATSPEEFYSNLCWGVGRLQDGGYDCASAAGGTAKAPFDANVSRSQWQAGEAALAALSPRPVVFNGLQGYDGKERTASIASVVVAAPNAWGAMCDTCFYGIEDRQNPYLWTSPILEVRLDGMMRVIGAGKNVFVVNPSVTNPAVRARALADLMLAYDPDRLWQWGGACGERSQIHVCPEAALTFYEPYQAYPKNTASLADPAGTYVREFAQCFDNGRSVGPCATVVNPDRVAAHAAPALRHTYRHTLVIHGTALCNCYGDTGAIFENGPSMPNSVPPASGYVIFQ